MKSQTLLAPEHATEQKAAISRANGAKSRGPVTEKGKTAGSRNSLKHGFYSQNITVQDHEVDDFNNLHLACFEGLIPRDDYEVILVDRIIMGNWRLYQVLLLESQCLNAADGFDEAADVLTRFARLVGAAERNLDKARRELREYRKTPRDENSLDRNFAETNPAPYRQTENQAPKTETPQAPKLELIPQGNRKIREIRRDGNSLVLNDTPVPKKADR